MNILINCSNLKNGGGLQVADSICGQLSRFTQHRFVVVLSTFLVATAERIKDFANVDVYTYDIPDSFTSVVLGRDEMLDWLVFQHQVNAVLTVFGPSRWRPRVPHLSGFALPQLVIPESPYFQLMNRKERLKWNLWCWVRKWSLKKSADIFWTENPYISERLANVMNGEQAQITGGGNNLKIAHCAIIQLFRAERRAVA